MIIYGRDARVGPRSLKHLFSGSYRNQEANRLSGIYELVLRRASEAGSPGLSCLTLSNIPASFILPASFP
jgi:kinesin family protein 1